MLYMSNVIIYWYNLVPYNKHPEKFHMLGGKKKGTLSICQFLEGVS